MNSRNRPAFAAITAIVLAAAAAGSGCAGRPASHDHAMAFEASPAPAAARKLWDKKIAGLITDLNVSRNGKLILVSSVPDSEQDKGPAQQYLLTAFSDEGRELWRLPAGFQIKAQAVAGDGSLAAFATYNDEVKGVDAAGRIVWTAEATCKPVFLTALRKILCFHDDDAGPGVAFDVFDWKGTRVASYPIANDALGLKLAADERAFAVSLTRGQVILFGPDLRSVWQRKVKGEILDLAVSSGDEPLVAVLYSSVKDGRKVALFDTKGRLRAEGFPAGPAEQVEISPAGDSVYVYANGPAGQAVALSTPEPASEKPGARAPALTERWRRGDARYADYSSSMIATRDSVIIGFEDIAPASRHSHLLAFDSGGRLRWNLPLVTEEGAYLYAQGFADEKSFLAVGTDDSVLSAYRIEAAPP